MKMEKHSTKPALKKLLKLCSDEHFKGRIEKLRGKWRIDKLSTAFEEANMFWRQLCKVDAKQTDYHERYDEGKTEHQRLQQDLEALCEDSNVRLPKEMWITMFQILLCFDFDNITEENFLELPVDPSLVRISCSPSYLNPIQDYHLYLDVTFASTQDVSEIWGVVQYWQENIRPTHIERGVLPDLLQDIKSGRPYGINEQCALEVAELKYDKKWTWAEIGSKYGWPLQYDSHENLNQCSTARSYAKRGLELRKRKG